MAQVKRKVILITGEVAELVWKVQNSLQERGTVCMRHHGTVENR